MQFRWCNFYYSKSWSHAGPGLGVSSHITIRLIFQKLLVTPWRGNATLLLRRCYPGPLALDFHYILFVFSLLFFLSLCFDLIPVSHKQFEYSKNKNKIILGRHGSVSLCRVERENKMAATYNVLAFKRWYFAWWWILYVQRHLNLLSGVAPSYSSKEIARDCY